MRQETIDCELANADLACAYFAIDLDGANWSRARELKTKLSFLVPSHITELMGDEDELN
jgi:hypothetical protein